MFEGEGNEGGAPRLTTSGADESRLRQCGRDALKSAGCLTCESEHAGASRIHRRHSGAARSAEPGIQTRVRCLHLDSGFAPSARPGMTAEFYGDDCAKITAPE